MLKKVDLNKVNLNSNIEIHKYKVREKTLQYTYYLNSNIEIHKYILKYKKELNIII